MQAERPTQHGLRVRNPEQLPLKSSSWTMRSLAETEYSEFFCEALEGVAAGGTAGAIGAAAGALGLSWSGTS